MEQEFHRQGLELSRQTMANWLLDSTDLWLKPIYECLHKKLLTHEVLHADETTLQVLHEEGRRPQSKSYMWIYRPSGDAEHQIVLYKYEQGRSGRYPEEFLQGFKGYLHSDGYSAYHNLGSDVINVGCLVHARRKFHDVIKLNKKDGANKSAAKAVGYFSKIFKLENALAKKSVEERYAKRLELEKPILDELFAWAEKLYVTSKSKLGEAVTYLRNQRRYLYNYLLDGRLEASNNRAERSLKPFVISRKNFLFANTAGGAEGSSIIFSLIETAAEEIKRREENKVKRAIKRANFPAYKTFNGYEYKTVKLPTILSKEELESLDFVAMKKNLVLYGPVGLGKTHMAIATGIAACQKGYKTKFFTVTGLVLELMEAKNNNVLEKFMKSIKNLDLLILDEWGYVPIDREASQLLYRVIDDCYEHTSMILTTNLEFSKWGNIYTDSQMTAAMIDRIVHHGYLLIFEGRSYRVEHALMRKETAGIVPKTKVIS